MSCFELLEDRRLLVCDAMFDAEQFFSSTGPLRELQQAIDSATVFDKQLPFVGDQIDDKLPFGADIRDELATSYNNAGDMDTPIQDKLAAAFTEVLGNHALLENLDVEFDAEACTITASLDLSRTLAAWETPGLQFDVGLQSLPIYASGDVSGVELQMGFEMSPLAISIDVDSGDVALDTDDMTFSFELKAEFAEGAEVSAQVGFLQMILSDGVGGESSSLDVGVEVGFGPDFSIGTTQVIGEANLLLHMQAVANENLPAISADFVLRYDLSSGAQSPEVYFDNVSINLGDVASKLLDPIVNLVAPVIEPLEVVNDILTKPIPVISDLGLGSYSVLDIANELKNVGALPPDVTAYVQLAGTISKIADFVGLFEGLDDGVAINFGQLPLSGLNDDLRDFEGALEPNLTVANISTLSIGAPGDLSGLIHRIGELNLPDEIKGVLVGGLSDIDDQLGEGASVEFPILDNPAGVVFQWLIGQNAELFTAQANFTLGQSDVTLGGNLPVGISGGLRGGFAPSLKLGIGYDTFGLRRFLDKHQSGTATGAELLDGFYITDDSQITITGELEGFLGLNTPVFSADFSGGITAEIHADVVGSDEDPEDGEPEKVRFRSEMGACAFALSGEIAAGIALTARLGVGFGPFFVGVEHRFDVAHAQIASFDTGCVGNPYYDPDKEDVTLAELIDGVLTLGAGPSEGTRTVALGEKNEWFELTPVPGKPQSVQVAAFGKTQVFEDVVRIEADMGDGFDQVTIAAGIDAEVEIFGGIGTDILRSYGSGSTTFYGDEGGDVLLGGTGDNFLFGGSDDDTITGVGNESATIEIDGDAGNDLIFGGLGQNLLRGGTGVDTITGGNGPNEIQGGLDDDILFGGLGINLILGGPGNDRITAGPGTNSIEGGNGDDTFFTSSGSSTIEGGNGDDRLSWDYGDGSVIFNGGSGFDSIGMIGSSGDDRFVLSNKKGAIRVRGPGISSPVETLSSDVEEVTVDGLFGQDDIRVRLLSGTPVQRVNINLTDNLARDGVEDFILIHGAAERDELLVENVEATLIEGDSDDPPVIGGVMRFSGFRRDPLSVEEQYEIFAMNFADHIVLNTHAGDDLVTVLGATGPTWINTSTGDDVIDVQATDLPDFEAESGFLDEIFIDGGRGSNELFIRETGTLVNDFINVTDDVVTSRLLPGVHYRAKGSGTFDQGISIIAGDQDDTILVAGTLRGSKTTIFGAGGNDDMWVNSNLDGTPGDLSSIRGGLVLDGGLGHTDIRLTDSHDNNPRADVVLRESTIGPLGAVEILGLAGPRDNVSIVVVDRVDQLLRIESSDSQVKAERFVIQTTILGETLIDDQNGNAEYIVERTRGDLHIVGGAGDERIRVTPTTQYWGDLLGSLTVETGAGNDRLEISDQATAELTFYELTADSLARGPAFLGTVLFDDQLESLKLSGAQVSDSVIVFALPVATQVDVLQGGGDNVVIGPATGASWEISGTNRARINGTLQVFDAATLVSGGGVNSFAILNRGSVTGAVVGSIAGHDTIDYSHFFRPVTVDLETQSATRVNSFDLIDQFIGPAAGGTLIGPNAETNWVLEGNAQGTVQIDGESFQWAFDSMSHLVGGAGDDHFLIEPNGQVDSVSGRGGVDLVNYSFFATDVFVDLQGGIATGIAQLSGIENATGGAGNDTLWGNQRANVLRGQSGNDVLVGGGGNDTLLGGLGDDILIGGDGGDLIKGDQGSDLLIASSTIYDRDQTALDSLRTRWADTNLSYQQRIASLTSPAFRTRLSHASVLSDAAVDELFGGTGSDWFWTDPNDNLNDLMAGEVVT